MTVLVLDNPPDMLAKAALAFAGANGQLSADADRPPHRTRFHYGFNKHTLDAPPDIDMLKRHAAYIKGHPPGMQVRIHGHADNFGSAEYNRFLARLRANAVARLLIQEACRNRPSCLPLGGARIAR